MYLYIFMCIYMYEVVRILKTIIKARQTSNITHLAILNYNNKRKIRIRSLSSKLFRMRFSTFFLKDAVLVDSLF